MYKNNVHLSLYLHFLIPFEKNRIFADKYGSSNMLLVAKGATLSI